MRQITSSVDNSSDPFDNYITSIYEWIHLRQGDQETEDAYKKKADTVTQNLILAGGIGVLQPRALFDTTKDANDEKASVMNKVRAVYLLCRSDMN